MNLILNIKIMSNFYFYIRTILSAQKNHPKQSDMKLSSYYEKISISSVDSNKEGKKEKK